MLSTTAGFGILAAPFLLFSFVIPYALLRLQDSRNPEHDPQIGVKSVFYFIFSLGVLIFLIGLNILVYDYILERTEAYKWDWSSAQRVSTSLMATGVGICLLHLLMILIGTNDIEWPGTRRVFIGYRLAIFALVVLGAVTILNLQLFDMWFDPNTKIKFENLKPVLSVLGVWGAAWLLHLILLPLATRGPGRRE
jgi:hypothetical protein